MRIYPNNLFLVILLIVFQPGLPHISLAPSNIFLGFLDLIHINGLFPRAERYVYGHF
jgi:hypothetical protein